MVVRVLTVLVLTGCGQNGSQGGQGHDHGSHQGTQVEAARKGVSEVIATVDGAPIGVDDFRTAASRRVPADGRTHTAEERQAILDGLVQEEALFQEALKKGLYQDSKIRRILVNQLVREEVHAKVTNDTISDEEIQAYYDDHKSEFVTPEKVQIRRILLRTRDDRPEAAAMKLASKLHAELTRDPRLFTELASKNSDGPYARRGGDLGFMSRDGKPGVDKAVVERAFKMSVNEISKPFVAGKDVQIIQLVARRDRTERSFQQMRGSVLRMVKQEKQEALKKAYIDEVLERYDVDVEAKKVQSVDLARRVGAAAPVAAPGHGHDHGDDGHAH